MKRSPREQAIYFLAILLAAAPFGFGLIRAVEARDLRLLWMAFAAFLGAALVLVAAKGRSGKPPAALTLSFVILLIAMMLAGLTAYVLGATAAAGIWPMAFVLAFCLAASYMLQAISVPRTT